MQQKNEFKLIVSNNLEEKIEENKKQIFFSFE